MGRIGNTATTTRERSSALKMFTSYKKKKIILLKSGLKVKIGMYHKINRSRQVIVVNFFLQLQTI